MLAKTMGWLLIIEGLFMLVPAIVGLIYKESDWIAFSVSAVVTSLIGLLMTSRIHPSYSNMGRREGFMLTASVWVVFSLFGMVPLMLCIDGLGVSDAFFETISGFTTTGVTILSSDVEVSHAVNLWRALTQWIGGMGIILFTLAVVPMLNSSGGMQMFNAEVTGITHEKVRPRISQTAKMLWLTYIALTAAAVLALWVGPMDFFDSVCHAFGTLSTGGFSTCTNGVADYDSTYVLAVLTIFMFLGGVNFGLILRSVNHSPRLAWRNEIFRMYVVIILVASTVFLISAIIAEQGWVNPVEPLFQVVALLTSTGYIIPGFSTWGPFVVGLVLIMVFVGGCAGSTSGGAKIDRTIMLVKYCYSEIRRCVHPNSITAVKLNGKGQPYSLVSKAVAFLCLYVIVLATGAMLLMILGEDTGDSFYMSLLCVSNAGLPASEVGLGFSPDITALPALSRWVCSWLMLVGRLEVYTVLILMARSFWHR